MFIKLNNQTKMQAKDVRIVFTSIKNNSSKYNHLKIFYNFVTQDNINIVKSFTVQPSIEKQRTIEWSTDGKC